MVVPVSGARGAAQSVDIKTPPRLDRVSFSGVSREFRLQEVIHQY